MNDIIVWMSGVMSTPLSFGYDAIRMAKWPALTCSIFREGAFLTGYKF